MLYACVAATKERARCRALVEENGQMCPFHQKEKSQDKEVAIAPAPDTVLVKFNVNPSWAQKFEEAGVPRRHPSEVSLEEKHVAHARQLGRDAYRYRDIADSGTPIFGEQGITDVSIAGLLIELQEQDYAAQGVHIRTRPQKKFDVLVIPFQRGAPGSLPKKAFDLLKEFLKLSCWGFAHVWANPPQESGLIVHTVNLGHREPDKKPDQCLDFNHGLWAVVSN